MKNQSYSQKEKLKKKKDLETLFKHGKWKSTKSLRIIFLQNQYTENIKIGVSVSKKNFKKAVDRNRIKRLLRENYRLNKTLFQEKWNNNVYAMIFWTGKQMPKNYTQVHQEIIKLLKEIR